MLTFHFPVRTRYITKNVDGCAYRQQMRYSLIDATQFLEDYHGRKRAKNLLNSFLHLETTEVLRSAIQHIIPQEKGRNVRLVEIRERGHVWVHRYLFKALLEYLNTCEIRYTEESALRVLY
jgi:hypothetical protein